MFTGRACLLVSNLVFSPSNMMKRIFSCATIFLVLIGPAIASEGNFDSEAMEQNQNCDGADGKDGRRAGEDGQDGEDGGDCGQQSDHD